MSVTPVVAPPVLVTTTIASPALVELVTVKMPVPGTGFAKTW